MVRFGEFRLDAAKRELWRGESLVHLPPKVFECIAYLAEHHDRAIGRDELISAVWGKVDVTDNLVDQIMLRARRAVGDINEERHVIRTIPRFGYAWVAPIEVADATMPVEGYETGSPPHLRDSSSEMGGADGAVTTNGGRLENPATKSSAAPPPVARDVSSDDRHARLASSKSIRSFRRLTRLGIALLAILGIGLLLFLAVPAPWKLPQAIRSPETAPKAVRPRSSLALVLPVVVKADDQFAWVRLGVMDLVAQRLRAAGQPVVPSDNVVALARGVDIATLTPPAIEKLAQTTSARLTLETHAESSQGYWHVTLRTIYGHDPPLTSEGDSQDVLDAARAATDRMAIALGLTPAGDKELIGSGHALIALLQQVEAAILSNQFETARALLESLNTEERERPEVVYQLARIDLYAGHLDSSQAALDSLLKTVSAKDDPILRARVLIDRGTAYLWRDDYASGERSADAAVKLLSKIDAPRELGRALTGRANALTGQNQFETALADFANARIALDTAGDRLGLARVDINIGILEASRDHFAEALPVMTDACARLATFHDYSNELVTRVVVAYSQLALLEPAPGLVTNDRLQELIAYEPNPHWIRYANLARAQILLVNGRLRDGGALLRQVREEASHTNDALLLAWAEAVSARQALIAGNVRQAAIDAQAAVNAPWGAKYPREYAPTWLTLLRAQLAEGNVEEAKATAAAAAAWATQNAIPVAGIYATLAKAEVAAATDEPKVAEAAFKQALARADANRVPADRFQVSEAYANWLIGRHDLAQAGIVVGKAADWANQDYDTALLQLRFYHALGNVTAWKVAVARARALAGERVIPPELLLEPTGKP